MFTGNEATSIHLENYVIVTEPLPRAHAQQAFESKLSSLGLRYETLKESDFIIDIIHSCDRGELYRYRLLKERIVPIVTV